MIFEKVGRAGNRMAFHWDKLEKDWPGLEKSSLRAGWKGTLLKSTKIRYGRTDLRMYRRTNKQTDVPKIPVGGNDMTEEDRQE